MCDAPIIHGIDLPARSLISLPNELDQSYFLVGTQSFKSANELHLLKFDEELGKVKSTSFSFNSGEVRHLASGGENLISIAYSSIQNNQLVGGVEIWEYELGIESKINFKLALQFTKPHVNIKSVIWGTSTVLVTYENCFELFDITEAFKSKNILYEHSQAIIYASLNPFDENNQIVFASGSSLTLFDIKNKALTSIFTSNELRKVKHFDFNTNVQYIIACGMDDGSVCIVDMRKPGVVLESFRDHRHWVCNVRFNPVHDQLLLTAGSDHILCLYHLSTLSSEKNESEEEKTVQDGLIERLTDHEDSVYSCAWSQTDPWAFASLSYDGRVNIYKIKRDLKYSIMDL
uniref:WD_REPEATS_REGION domain-containing protein n=1 Tax=Rhabditophanes sp. KR3021 TaxID=114890 RepID=A0AC35TU98_9BILA